MVRGGTAYGTVFRNPEKRYTKQTTTKLNFPSFLSVSFQDANSEVADGIAEAYYP
jgi:hypothetical protein